MRRKEGNKNLLANLKTVSILENKLWHMVSRLFNESPKRKDRYSLKKNKNNQRWQFCKNITLRMNFDLYIENKNYIFQNNRVNCFRRLK